MKTIAIGIDLGTTNSAVAVVNGDSIDIVKTAAGEETTPSVVFADRNGNLVVGSKAKKKLLDEPANGNTPNGQGEIKRLMGTNERVMFPNLNGKRLSPEEISAEILSTLRNDVQRKFPEANLSAAVITVPAHFSTVQAEATKRAGQLAGFNRTVLLQEPIAAAIAYGFLNNRNENWLVYDLGGGTFDVALVAFREGGLTILSHNGDNFLGGKDIDASIVDLLIIPALKIKGISLDPMKHAAAYQRARKLAEEVKIELTSTAKTTLELNLIIDGKEVSESLELSREALFGACEKIFRRTADLCRKTISEAKVSTDSISRLVLVGGPTQMEVLRAYLQKELGYKIDGSLDPLTVVARGAALFGRQVQLVAVPDDTHAAVKSADCHAKLNFASAVSDDSQTLTGIVSSSQGSKDGPSSICIQSEDGEYSSGDLILKNGKFICQLPTGKRGHTFWLYVKTNSGNLLSCNPDSFSVSRGVSISGAPIPHSIGVSIVTLDAAKGFSELGESMDIFFKRSSTLPLKEKKKYYTVRDLHVGSSDNALPIRVYEGESAIPDRNTLVCDLALTGLMVPRDIPKGSPVEISIIIDESRELSVTTYIPLIDLTLNARATIHDAPENMDEIRQTLSAQNERSEQLSETSPESAKGIQEMISDIEATIERSGADSDQKRKASKQVRDLKVTLDEVEARSKFESNAKLYGETIEEIAAYFSAVDGLPDAEQHAKMFLLLKGEGDVALAAKDGIALQQVIDKMKRFHMQCLLQTPAFLLAMYSEIKDRNPERIKEPAFAKLVAQLESAIKDNSVEKLRSAVIAMYEYMGQDTQGVLKNIKSGITR